MTLTEILFDRVANHAAKTKKTYAIMSRSAWPERALSPLQFENNTHEYQGVIIDPKNPVYTGEEKVIGFFHPLFVGYIFKYGVIEVILATNPRVNYKYLAIGRGYSVLAAYPVCLDSDPAKPLCIAAADPPCTNPIFGLSPMQTDPPDPLGSENSVVFYDYDSMSHTMGPNEIPAKMQLPGYSGTVPRPDPKRPLLVNWQPNWAAFQLTFQICKPATAGGSTQGQSGGWGPDCCSLVQGWKDQYGPNWCAVIAGQIRSGQIKPLTGVYAMCNYLLDWISKNC
jgi:hypothetical protein